MFIFYTSKTPESARQVQQVSDTLRQGRGSFTSHSSLVNSLLNVHRTSLAVPVCFYTGLGSLCVLSTRRLSLLISDAG